MRAGDGESMVRRFMTAVSGADTLVKDVIDRMSVAKNLERQKVRSSLYASDYGQCPRKVFLQFFPEEFPPDSGIDGRTARVFENGNKVHERLGEYLKMAPGLEFVDEVNVPRDDLDVHGRCDGVITVDDGVVVLEFKSINKTCVDEPKEEHVGQVTWYMFQFTRLREELRGEFEVSEGVPDIGVMSRVSLKGRSFIDLTALEQRLLLSQGDVTGEVIYELKGNQQTVHFPVEYDVRSVEKVRSWFEGVKTHVEKRLVPVVKYASNRFPCAWGFGANQGRCSYFEYCHGERQELLQLGPRKGSSIVGDVVGEGE